MKLTLIELKEEKEPQKKKKKGITNIYIENYYFEKYLCWQEYHGFDYSLKRAGVYQKSQVHNPFHSCVGPVWHQYLQDFPMLCSKVKSREKGWAHVTG